MVLLTIVAPSSEPTVYFGQPIKKPNYNRLLSCTFYNSWHNLKKRGALIFYDKNNKPNTAPLLPGYYTLKTLAPIIENMFKASFNTKIPTQINQPTGAMIIYNTSGHKIRLDTDLAELFGE